MSIERIAAALADRYTIERELGAGGMATVYLAEDLKHHRKVAIKVLRPELAAVIGAERFLAEIRTTANLQHPHILALIDSGDSGGMLWYVMPYVEGESLRDRITHEKQLPVADAVRIATEVAGALDYAHRHHVVHRDIKPENILLHDGSAMVADFGIALAASSGAGTRMTETGMSLGTPHYMSPEQAMGEREITARSDVYALGCITYEMLVGEPPFTGPTAQAIIARVMTEEPRSLTLQRKSVPPHVEAAVFTALEKLPADRFATAAEFAAALGEPRFATTSTRGSSARAIAHTTSRSRATLLLATACVALCGLALAGWLRRPPTPTVTRQRIALWQHSLTRFLSPGVDHEGTQAAIAADGATIVFTDSANGGLELFRKRRSEIDPVPLDGTQGAISPFFSPDGSWIGYLTIDGRVRKLPASGGGSITLATDASPEYPSGAWLDDGSIVYYDVHLGLSRVQATGGPSHRIRADSSRQQFDMLTLAPLPGSHGVLFAGCPGNCSTASDIYVFDFKADSARRLVTGAVNPVYASTGQLLYTDRGGGVYAESFDLQHMTTTSGPVPVVDSVVPGTFALSASGTILYLAGSNAGAPAELMTVAADGRAEPVDSTWIADFNYPALSPDGRTLAVSVSDRTTQIWIRHADGSRQQLTDSGSVNWRPSWAPDGRSLLFASNMRGGVNIDGLDVFTAPTDGSAPPALVMHYKYGLWESELSRDGEWLAVRSDEASGNSNVHARRMSGDTTVVPVVIGKGVSIQIALSPDAKWLAYVNQTTGRREVYVTSFPDGRITRLISNNGGSEPRWSRSGRELFYESNGRMVAIDIGPGAGLVTGVPRPLFSIAGYRTARNRQQYDIAPDDQHFVMIKDLNDDPRGKIVLVENWLQELQRKTRR